MADKAARRRGRCTRPLNRLSRTESSPPGAVCLLRSVYWPQRLLVHTHGHGALSEHTSLRLLSRALPKPPLQSCRETQIKLLHGINLLVFTLRSLNS